MNFKSRVGTFCIFCGALTLLIFWASLNSSDKSYALISLLAGAALVAVGWTLRASKPPAGSGGPNESAARAKAPGLLAGLGRKPPPPPPPPPPPAPPKRKGLGSLFRSKPEKAVGGEGAPGGKPPSGQPRPSGNPKSR